VETHRKVHHQIDPCAERNPTLTYLPSRAQVPTIDVACKELPMKTSTWTKFRGAANTVDMIWVRRLK
jgi:hypothetical protein